MLLYLRNQKLYQRSWKGKCSVLTTCTWNLQENDTELACKHHKCGPVIQCFKMQIVVVFIGSKSKYKCSWINNVSSAEWFYPLGCFLWFEALAWAELFMNCRSSLFWHQSVTSLLTHCAVNSWKRIRFYFSLNKHYCHSFFPPFSLSVLLSHLLGWVWEGGNVVSWFRLYTDFCFQNCVYTQDWKSRA